MAWGSAFQAGQSTVAYDNQDQFAGAADAVQAGLDQVQKDKENELKLKKDELDIKSKELANQRDEMANFATKANNDKNWAQYDDAWQNAYENGEIDPDIWKKYKESGVNWWKNESLRMKGIQITGGDLEGHLSEISAVGEANANIPDLVKNASNISPNRDPETYKLYSSLRQALKGGVTNFNVVKKNGISYFEIPTGNKGEFTYARVDKAKDGTLFENALTQMNIVGLDKTLRNDATKAQFANLRNGYATQQDIDDIQNVFNEKVANDQGALMDLALDIYNNGQFDVTSVPDRNNDGQRTIDDLDTDPNTEGIQIAPNEVFTIFQSTYGEQKPNENPTLVKTNLDIQNKRLDNVKVLADIEKVKADTEKKKIDTVKVLTDISNNKGKLTPEEKAVKKDSDKADSIIGSSDLFSEGFNIGKSNTQFKNLISGNIEDIVFDVEDLDDDIEDKYPDGVIRVKVDGRDKPVLFNPKDQRGLLEFVLRQQEIPEDIIQAKLQQKYGDSPLVSKTGKSPKDLVNSRKKK